MSEQRDIGSVTCPFSGRPAPVRKNKHGRLYFLSDAGLIQCTGPSGQEWLRKNAEFYSGEVKNTSTKSPPDSGTAAPVDPGPAPVDPDAPNPAPIPPKSPPPATKPAAVPNSEPEPAPKPDKKRRAGLRTVLDE